jgi:hypothetical protein
MEFYVETDFLRKFLSSYNFCLCFCSFLRSFLTQLLMTWPLNLASTSVVYFRVFQ